METEIQNDDSPQVDAEIAGPTVGSCLKAERERQGMSEKQVADRLHITMHYVRAIETDGYEKLPGIVFARGYIRNYGLLLGLDEDELVEQFDAIVAERSRETRTLIQTARRNKRQSQILIWLLIAIGAFLAGYLVFWSYNRFFVAGQNDVTGTDEGGAQLYGPVVQSGPDAIVLRGTVLRPQPPGSASQPVPASRGQAEPIIRQIERQLPVGLITDQPRVFREQGGGQITEVVTLGSDLLQITFSDSGWVEIKGADAVPIYRDLHRSGDILQITGRAPFDVLLGDAGSASIKLNQLDIPVVDNIRIDNTARLLVGL
jgi:cytoskeleton protein RodZ